MKIPVCSRVEYRFAKPWPGIKTFQLYVPIVDLIGKEGYAGPYYGHYNPSSKIFYLNEKVFESVRLKGHPMVLLYDGPKTNKQNFGNNLAVYSVLMECGYNVNSESNLSQAQRRAILSSLNRRGIASRKQIISLLEWFIATRGGRENMENAVYKWEQDLQYVKSPQFKS